jgi:hypothetical protein
MAEGFEGIDPIAPMTFGPSGISVGEPVEMCHDRAAA